MYVCVYVHFYIPQSNSILLTFLMTFSPLIFLPHFNLTAYFTSPSLSHTHRLIEKNTHDLVNWSRICRRSFGKHLEFFIRFSATNTKNAKLRAPLQSWTVPIENRPLHDPAIWKFFADWPFHECFSILLRLFTHDFGHTTAPSISCSHSHFIKWKKRTTT